MSKAYDNFGMEMRLRELDPALHKRFTDTVSVTGNLLFRYKRYFPEYNDHSGLHSMSVIDLCNQLIGKEQILRLNQDELYILVNGVAVDQIEVLEYVPYIFLSVFFKVRTGIVAGLAALDEHLSLFICIEA